MSKITKEGELHIDILKMLIKFCADSGTLLEEEYKKDKYNKTKRVWTDGAATALLSVQGYMKDLVREFEKGEAKK